jgi:MoaA/NifB/PqqE/SkfB family radical SAM enzyme
VTARHPNIVFTPFTNGLLVSGEHIRRLKQQRHVLPIVSFEGYELETDRRRGLGVYDNGFGLIQRFNQENIYFGVSITATRGNLDLITSPSFIRSLADQGCKVFFFINYIPVAEGTDEMAMTRAQVDELNRVMSTYRREHQALFLAFPGSEIDFGGCLAAGKGFVHINPAGDVQPCPFSPYSDANLKEMPLIEALKSPLLATIRENSARLDESNGICALWNTREWVAGLVERKQVS